MGQYRCTVETSNTSSTVEGDAEATAAQDGRLRVVWSCDDFGRGVSITIKPLTADTQFVLHSMSAYVVPSLAGPEDL